MPPHDIGDAEMGELLAFVHTLRPAAGGTPRATTAKLENGGTLQGQILNQSSFDLQLATSDGRIHFLTAGANGAYREKPLLPKMDWPRYDGSFSGNRHSTLRQINTTNVQRLALEWMFPVPDAPRLESIPLCDYCRRIKIHRVTCKHKVAKLHKLGNNSELFLLQHGGQLLHHNGIGNVYTRTFGGEILQTACRLLRGSRRTGSGGGLGLWNAPWP